MFYKDARNWQIFQFANRYVFPDSEHEGVEKAWNHQVLWSTYWRYIKLPFWLAAKMCRSQFGHLTCLAFWVLPRHPIVPTTVFLDMSQRLGDWSGGSHFKVASFRFIAPADFGSPSWPIRQSRPVSDLEICQKERTQRPMTEFQASKTVL